MVSSAQDYDYLFKILMIGSSGVGKSCLLLRFADDNFNEQNMPTIGVDFKIRTLDVDTKVCKLQVWDTAGQERFKTITSSYYKGAAGIIVTYDITDRDSFNAVHTWMSEIEKYTPTKPSITLVGNKSDLVDRRAVSEEEGREMAEHYRVRFLETSAKECKNVETSFTTMTRTCMGNIVKPLPGHEGPVRKLAPNGPRNILRDQKKQGCCQ